MAPRPTVRTGHGDPTEPGDPCAGGPDALRPRIPGSPREQGSRSPLSREEVAAFRRFVYHFYAREGRHSLPWRLTADPYEILVSEIMLQQTQVPRVLGKYEAFLGAFPTVEDLAEAPLEEILRLWQGLGYNRRAKNLSLLAKEVVRRYGTVPADYGDLVSLPGVGAATAGAVSAFAFGRAVPFLETNIRTVFLHHFFSGRESVTDRSLILYVEATLDVVAPRQWYYALMDYGARLKRLVPNPSRRSRVHVSAVSFEGSTRQLRGRVIGALVNDGPMTVDQLVAKSGRDTSAVEEVIARLAREGFVSASNDRWRIT